MTINQAASIRARLTNYAKAERSDFQQVLVRYTLERLLYRLSKSRFADQFVLKGALLFSLWYDMPHRATRDADLLGFGDSDLTTIRQTFEIVAAVPCDDGIVFAPETVRVEAIRKEAGYPGARILITATLAGARCVAQVDIGFGDAVTPAPIVADYPVLLDDLPAPTIRTYPVYTVLAEKLHAISILGMTNTRLKDYFDLALLLEREAIDPAVLATALAATFARRSTLLPDALPVGLSDAFSLDQTRQTLWLAFLRRNAIPVTPLDETVTRLRAAFEKVFELARTP